MLASVIEAVFDFRRQWLVEVLWNNELASRPSKHSLDFRVLDIEVA